MQIRAFFDDKGSFNNYVDKMRGEGVQKIAVFVHADGGGGSENGHVVVESDLLI